MNAIARTPKPARREHRLLSEERRQKVMELLEQQGRVMVEELVARFGVSSVTVRGDLDALSEMGALKRSHGGAVRALEPARDYPLKVKEALHLAEKSRIGQAAAQMIQANQTIILDSGSTTAQLARHLKRLKTPGLTVITNSLNIAAELADTAGLTLIMLGGILRRLSHSFVGPHAEQMLRELHADHLFLAVDGLDPETGPSTPDVLEAQLNGLMVRAANHVTVVADSSKFGRRSLSIIAPMNRIHRVITDTGIQPRMAEAVRRHGIDLITV